ncbi:MAG: hypothetical protein RMM98_04175 [Acidobacteriota bacterium]|nr:hypothetical protein [Blastocatellia bacterium]MDW8238788.1 hypothetical protein [Acidobacteriota bacterium]
MRLALHRASEHVGVIDHAGGACEGRQTCHVWKSILNNSGAPETH